MSTDTPDTADDAAQVDAQEQETAEEAAGDTTDESQETTEEEGAGETEEEGEEERDPQALMKWVRDHGKRDQTSRFSHDGQYIDAFDEMQTRLSQRDEDAAIGRQLRESGRQEELLGAKQPETKVPPVAPKSEIKLLGQVVRLLGKDAPAELVDRLNAARGQASDTMHQLMSDPEKFLKPHIDRMAQGIVDANAQTLQQQSAAQQLANDIGQLEQANPWMWADGKAPQPGQQANLSPEGQGFVQEAKANKQNFGMLYDEAGNVSQFGWNDAQVLKYTLDRRNDQQAAQRKPTRTAGKKARRTAETATTIPDQTPPKKERFRDKCKRLNDERIARERGEVG